MIGMIYYLNGLFRTRVLSWYPSSRTIFRIMLGLGSESGFELGSGLRSLFGHIPHPTTFYLIQPSDPTSSNVSLSEDFVDSLSTAAISFTPSNKMGTASGLRFNLKSHSSKYHRTARYCDFHNFSSR